MIKFFCDIRRLQRRFKKSNTLRRELRIHKKHRFACSDSEIIYCKCSVFQSTAAKQALSLLISSTQHLRLLIRFPCWAQPWLNSSGCTTYRCAPQLALAALVQVSSQRCRNGQKKSLCFLRCIFWHALQKHKLLCFCKWPGQEITVHGTKCSKCEFCLHNGP